MSYITCSDLELGYDGRVVTKGISFTVDPGDYLCIVGENGAGKSTLMKTILKLQNPMKGTVEYGDGLTRRELGYLPQQTVVQKDFPASVQEIVLSGNLSRIGFHPFYGKKEKERARRAMERLSVWELKDKCYRNLSGGQQQRVLLSRALVATEKLLLLDEPVSGLDPKVTAEMYQLIRELNQDGLTVIMISHDISMATRYASHILHLGRKQLFFGKTEDYLLSDAWKIFGKAVEEE
ncbi:MAG: metal ABC transporter ATP-binding protein [Eubacterium sp.]|nr:metal ABC transporter ATP-binding protein [Eubacterium sp.]